MEQQSWVISVRLKKGCYRHLEIPKFFTLEELAEEILSSFDFMNDHAHAFFLDNHAWVVGKDSYYCVEVDEEDEYQHTCDYTLEQVLSLKQKFVFIFDFGMEWRFDCTVLREVKKRDNEVYLVKEVGESPDQYEYFDDYDELDEDF